MHAVHQECPHATRGKIVYFIELLLFETIFMINNFRPACKFAHSPSFFGMKQKNTPPYFNMWHRGIHILGQIDSHIFKAFLFDDFLFYFLFYFNEIIVVR